jgi:hypothetical protein
VHISPADASTSQGNTTTLSRDYQKSYAVAYPAPALAVRAGTSYSSATVQLETPPSESGVRQPLANGPFLTSEGTTYHPDYIRTFVEGNRFARTSSSSYTVADITQLTELNLNHTLSVFHHIATLHPGLPPALRVRSLK